MLSDQIEATEEHFERYFEGVWTPRWWNVFAGLTPLCPPVVITSYSEGEVTGGMTSVSGRDNAGTRIEFTGLKPTSKGLGIGWKRTEAPPHGKER